MIARTPAAEAVLDALTRLRITTISATFLEGTVTPARSGGSTYRVRISRGGRWTCSCPAATYSGRRAEPCKHATALRTLAAALPGPLRGDWTK